MVPDFRGKLRAFKDRDGVILAQLHSRLTSAVFDPYIEEKARQIGQSRLC